MRSSLARVLAICVAVLLLCNVAYATEGAFPDTGAPHLYNPENEENPKATAPDWDNGLVPGNRVENIEDYEESVARGERSSLFDGAMMICGGAMFFYAALLILAYGLDRVSVIPNVSILKWVTFGQYDIYGITVWQFLLRDCALLCAGILLGSGLAKKLFTFMLIAIRGMIQ